MDISIILDTMMVLFGIMALGYGANRAGVLDEVSNGRISRLVISVTTPLMIIKAVFSESLTGDKSDVVIIFLLGLGMYTILPIFARIAVRLLRVKPDDSGTYEMMLIFANTSFIGYPIMKSLFGDWAVFYSSILNMPFNFLVFTYGVYLVSRNSKDSIRFGIREILNPGVVASLVALLLYFTGIRLPSGIISIMGLVGDTTVPLSMLAIGSSLALIPVKDLFREPRIYVLSAIKLLIMPSICYLLLSMVLKDQFLVNMITINVGLPAGTMTVMISNQYNGNTRMASIGVFITTLASVATVPLIAYLFMS
jgi:Predicted permeases